MFFFLSAILAAPLFCSADNSQYNLEKIFYLAGYNAEAGVASVNKNWQEIDILAPQMYIVNSNFTVSGGFGPKLKKAIEDHNLKVMPLVANAGFSQKIIHNLLESQVGQDKVINALISTATNQKYIGWQIDFENINYLDKDLFTAFVQKAYPLFQKNNLIFSVAVIPRTADYEDTNAFKNWGGAYDYKKIADSCDFISLMAYDDSNSVGPVASIDFVNNILDYVKDKIPAQKLSLGVPLYYWKWSAAQNKKVGVGSYKNLLTIEENYRYNLGFDIDLGVAWLTYFFNNKEYKIWFEDKQSFQAKLNIAKDDNLRGFSAWLLGGEDPAIWSILKQ
ncbi:MAG: glycosyl hydrolase family 18 protein [Candidatus Staskawiczbacteria bacterium]